VPNKRPLELPNEDKLSRLQATVKGDNHARGCARKERSQVLGLGMIMGVRSTLFQEDHMARKVEMLAVKADAVEGEAVLAREGLKLAEDMPLKEQVIFTGSSDWTPDQAEHYIDWRIQCIDSDIARLRQQLDDLIASRKRWLAVTGGRSKVFGISNGNGHGATTQA